MRQFEDSVLIFYSERVVYIIWIKVLISHLMLERNQID